MRYVKTKFLYGHFAAGLSPLGSSEEDTKMGMFLMKSKGLVTYSLYSIKNEKVYQMTEKKSCYKSFCLDTKWVNMANEISYGHRLMLANPRAGKSVSL